MVPFAKHFHIPLQVPFTAIPSSTGHSAGTLLFEKELPMTRHYFASLLLATPGLALAAAAPTSLTDCAAIAENGKRLACFDRLATTAGVTPVDPAALPTAALAQPEPATPPSPVISANHQDRAAPDSTLKGYWELGQENKHGRFVFQPYQPNYLIANYTQHPNDAPYAPLRNPAGGNERLAHGELSFQLSFKTKLIENAFGSPADLWFGYTQRSFWQAGNKKASSPFRETNYLPELMAVIPVNFQFAGVDARFINLGLIHQSNGQAGTLSRSWNRVYVQAGLERGDYTLLARVWKRFNEPADSDNNPTIIDYMGHGDLQGTYRHNGHEVTALTRYNFQTNKGALQLAYAFPLLGRLKGYVRGFAGYGQTMIDYDYSQKSIGAGFLLDY